MPASSNHRRPGMTLLEIVLSMGLMVVLSSMAYWFYASSLETTRKETKTVHKLRLVRAVMDRIAEEIRQASQMTTAERMGIRGEAERIWLLSQRLPERDLSADPRTLLVAPPHQYDLAKVEYKIARHPEIQHDDGYDFPLGLARVEILIPRPDSAETGEAHEGVGNRVPAATEAADVAEQGSGALDEELLLADQEDRGDVGIGPQIQWEELYAPEIKYLRFCYFDGHQWWDDWDITGDNPLPQLVQITLGYSPHPPMETEFSTQEDEEFCSCLNEDPEDCLPLGRDEYSTLVRVSQSDPFFRSRITRETQSLIEQLVEEPEE